MGGILTIDTIVKDPTLRKHADDIMDETIAIANADLASRGIDPSLYLDDTVVRKNLLSELSQINFFFFFSFPSPYTPLFVYSLRKKECGTSPMPWVPIR
ncbi:MAG: hypothetical protein ACK55I_40815, partial [bacterium]